MTPAEWAALAACVVALLAPLCVGVWHVARIDQSVTAMRRGFSRLLSGQQDHEQRLASLENERRTA